MSTVKLTDSGMTLEVDEGSWFRFANMAAYRPLGGDAIKEMDFGYFNHEAGGIDLVELKSYTKADKPPKIVEILPDLISKGRDSLLLLQAAWRGHGPGPSLAKELPESCRSKSRLRFHFVIRPNQTQRDQLTPRAILDLQGRLRMCIVSYARLIGFDVGVNDVFLFDEQKGMEKLKLTLADSES